MKSPYRPRFLFFLVMLLSLTSHASEHPAFSKFKLFRNYYHITDIHPYKSHFEFWMTADHPFAEGESAMRVAIHCEVRVDSVEEIQNLDLDWDSWGPQPCKMLRGQALLEAQTKTRFPVPSSQATLSSAAETLFKNGFSNVRDFEVSYLGSNREVEVIETVPMGVDEHGFDVLRSWGLYLINEKTDKVLFSDFQRSYGTMFGTTSMCESRAKCDEEPRLIPFIPDEDIRGSLLLSQGFDSSGEGKSYAKEQKRFFKTFLKTLRDMDKESYKNPLAKILEKQGSAQLPKDFNQHLALDLTLYGRPRAGSGVAFVSENVKIYIPVKEAYSSGIEIKKSIPSLDLIISAKVNLKTGTASVTAIPNTGGAVSVSHKLIGQVITPSKKEVGVLGTLKMEPVDSSISEISLTGHANFDSIDIYLPSSLTTSPFHPKR